MVIIALLVGLLMPALSRAKEEARKTQCRSNLRQIGFAMMIYAGDNGGWTPEIGGVHGGLNSNMEGYFPSSEIACDVYGLLLAFEPPCEANLIFGQPQHWLCTKARPSRPVGLGLLWAGGYLTKAGAQILYCPSNQSGPAAKGLRNDIMRKFDADEPFWTSNGNIVRGDADRRGDWEIPYIAPFPCWDGAATPSSGVCQVISNYDIRFHKLYYRRAYYNVVNFYGRLVAFQTAIKLHEVGKCGLVADTLEMFLGTEPENVFGPVQPPPPERYLMAENYVIRNHVNAWNILFADGSVKTYVDGSKAIIRVAIDRWSENVPSQLDGPSEPMTRPVDTSGDGQFDTWELDAYIWTPFLDSAYQQD